MARAGHGGYCYGLGSPTWRLRQSAANVCSGGIGHECVHSIGLCGACRPRPGIFLSFSDNEVFSLPRRRSDH